MIKVTLIALGNLKEKYLKDAAAEYSKRLSGYCELKIVELSPVKLPERPSEAQISNALEKEATAIIKAIPSGSFSVALCIEGKSYTSENFAKKINNLCAEGKPLTLIIGSSYGLSETVKRYADMRLSVSDMTFPHQLFRIMLLEQLYRTFKINSGGSYHK